MKLERVLVPIFVVAMSALAVAYARRVPRPVPASASPGVFSAGRAMAHVTEMARAAHPPGTAEHARVRGYVVSQLRAIGLSPQVQEITAVGTRYAVAGRVSNVLVRVPGTRAGGMGVLLVAHYDGVPAGPAAGDDASGVAVLLETIRAVRANEPLANDVIALFTDGEEAGLLGAAGFVAEHAWAKDVGVVLNFEARGTHGPSLMFETGRGNLDVVRELRRVPGVRATSLSTAVYRELPNDTDLSELALLEQPALNFAFIGGVDRYHTSEDDVANLGAGSVQHHGDQALALARAFGNGPLPRPVTGDAVFFDVPLLGLIVYPTTFAAPFAVVAIALVIVGILRLRRDEERWLRGVILGAAGSILSLALVAGMAIGLAHGLQWLHGTLPTGGAPEWSGVYAVALALIAIAVVAAMVAVARRWASGEAIFPGALLVLAMLSVWVALEAPGMSYLLTWPVFLAALAAVASSTLARAGIVARVPILVVALVTISLIVPTVYLMVCVALGLEAAGAAILAAFTAIAVWSVLPLLDGMLTGAPWRVTSMILAAGGLVLVAGAATTRQTPRRPAASTLTYAVDGDSSRAWLTGAATSPLARRWLERSLPDAGTAQPSAIPPAWLTRSASARAFASVPAVPMASPKAERLRETMNTGGLRVVLLRVTPAPGTRSIVMSAEPGVVIDAAVDGRRVDRARYRRPTQTWTLQYIAPPDSGFTLQLMLGPAARPALSLQSRRSGIPALPGVRLPARTDGILAIQEGDMTVVHSMVSLRP